MPVTYIIRLDKRRARRDKAFPIKVWVTKNGRAIPYSTLYSLSEDDFRKLNSSNIREDLRIIRDALKQLAASLDDYLKDNDSFEFNMFNISFVPSSPHLKLRKRGCAPEVETKDDFDITIYERKFRIIKEPNPAKDSLLGGYLACIISLLRIKSVKTADIYQSTFYSLFAFRGNVKLRQITPQYLKEYDMWMREQGRKKTTVGMYLRTLRKIINDAINDGLINRKAYPFGRNKYIIPSGKNVKKAIPNSSIHQIYYYKPECDREAFARDTWLFLYFGNGMNPKDMAMLKYKHIIDGFIVFERNKTANTARENSKPITVFITPELQQIIDKWGNKKVNHETFVFPILNDDMNPLRQMLTIQNFVKLTNDYMKKIFLHLNIKGKGTTILARHSLATHMLYAGAPKELIQESLGHHNIQTTENYLASFEKHIVKEFANKLTAFNKPVEMQQLNIVEEETQSSFFDSNQNK